MPAALLSRDDLVVRLGDVFREHGFEGTSLSVITEATGLGKGSLYNHFPGGKEEMAVVVLSHIDGWFELQVYEPLRKATDARAAVAAMFDTVDRYFRSGGRVCLVGVFALDATRDLFARAVRSYFAGWVEALAACLARGGMHDARLQAETVVAGIQGALVLSRALNDKTVFTRQLRQLQAQTEAGLPDRALA